METEFIPTSSCGGVKRNADDTGSLLRRVYGASTDVVARLVGSLGLCHAHRLSAFEAVDTKSDGPLP